MKKRKRHARGLGAFHCKPNSIIQELPDYKTSGCVTERKTTFCVGDLVGRPKYTKSVGHIIALGRGRENSGKKTFAAAAVCFENDEPGDTAYTYALSELKKKR